MKAFVSTLCLLSIAAAAPTVETRIAQDGPITWKGKIFTDQEEYTLTGDAKSIYDQIRTIRPDFDTSEFNNATDINARGVTKRYKSNGSCGNFDTGNTRTFDYNGGSYQYLANLGGTTCQVNSGPGTCIRVSCADTTGIYLCNDNRSPISPNCAYLAGYARDIRYSCATNDNTAFSGQEFDTDNYNVIVGYSNCNHPSSEGPGRPGDGWGPNGPADVQCDGCIRAYS